MLTRVEIRNFKNIKDTKITFNSKLTGIYGPNGSGKTSIIELFTLFKDDLLSYDIDEESVDTIEQTKEQTLEKLILKYVKNGEDTLDYKLEFIESSYTFEFSKKFNIDRNKKNEITYEESVSYKRSNSREQFKSLYYKVLDHNDSFLEYTFFNEPQQLEFNISNMKKAVGPYSLFSNALSEVKVKKNSDVIQNARKLLRNIQNARIFTLSDQSISNLGLAIPIPINEAHNGSSVFGTLPIIQWDHYYTETEVNLIMHAVEAISELLSNLIPGKKLGCEVFKQKIDDDNNLISSISVYTITNDEKVNIGSESTGVIKLVSLISLFNEVVSFENAIVIIDELDAHIFEFLLSKIVKVINELIKGQFIFTAHNLTLFETLTKNNIIFSYADSFGNIHFSEFPKVNKTENMRNKYIRLQALSDNEKIKSADISENLIFNALYTTSMKAFLDKEKV